MFKKLAADALGLSDIGVVIGPADYDKVEADDYLFHEELKDIYKALTSIGQQQAREGQARQHALHASNVVGSMYKLTAGDPDAVSRQYVALLDAVNTAVLDRHSTRDFGPVFEKYIHA
jgi:hypothetical protein